MKMLLVALSLGLCVPAYSLEQTQVRKNIKKDNESKSDAIKGAVTLAVALVTGYCTKKISNDSFNEYLRAKQALLEDPRFTPYINPKGEVLWRSMPDDIRQQFEMRYNQLGVSGAILKSLISGLICCGTGIAAVIYCGNIIYKSINRITYSNESIKIAESEETQAA